MSVRMRHTSGHSKNRRSHHALTAPRLSTCEKCGKSHIRHRMCDNCGTYNGREVVDVLAKQNKKKERFDRKTRELGQEVVEDKTEKEKEPKTLNPEDLSKK